MRPLTAVINRQIRMTTPAKKLCNELAGSVIAVHVNNTALHAYFEVEKELLNLLTDTSRDPDVVVSGSLLSLASLARSDAAIRSGAVELRGDAELAQSFRHLLQLAKPDLEEELSSFIGDAPAHGIGEVARRIGEWSRDARSTMRQNISEYLQEESRALPSRNEISSFRSDVNSLRDDAARLDARIRRIESQLAGD